MAEDCTRAFGRYLRMLRERRALSLDEVCSLSQTFPEKITKGYLSRCENGRQKLAFAKVIPLSRIYEVPADVLVERMELDMELDRVGGPDCEGDFMAVTETARMHSEQGRTWSAYALLRDVVLQARSAPLSSRFRSDDEQHVTAMMNCASAARALGRYRFALHEYEYVAASGELGLELTALVHERIATCHRSLGHLEQAHDWSARAVELHEALESREFLGYAYATHANILFDRDRKGDAAKFFTLAYETHRDNGQEQACPTLLNGLAQCYFDLRRLGAARRTIDASLRLSEELNALRAHGLGLLLRGEIDEIDNRPEQATVRWKRAIQIAKELDNRTLQFKAEFLLLRRALQDDNKPAIRAIHRRMNRLANAIPVDTFELKQYRDLLESSEFVARRQ